MYWAPIISVSNLIGITHWDKGFTTQGSLLCHGSLPTTTRPTKFEMADASNKKKITLTDVPRDILFQIVIHLHQYDDNDQKNNLRSFALTCKDFYQLYHSISHGGQYAIPLSLPKPLKTPHGLNIRQNNNRSMITIQKTSTPGDAYVVFDKNISKVSCSWKVKLEQFKGHRIEIGIALPSAFRFGMVERASSWSFDCFGRACIAGKNITYGRQILNNESITIVYDSKHRTLSFLDVNHISMGCLHMQITDDSILYPFIYFPYFKGECLSIIYDNSCILDLEKVDLSKHTWKKRANLPFDNHIIVSTWEDCKWYALNIDPDVTSLADFWKLLEVLHGMDRTLFQLIFNGMQLPYRRDKMLKDVGIVIDKRTGSCSADILLSVPHVIS